MRILRLSKPAGASDPGPRPKGFADFPVLRSPVEFEWESFGDGAEYQVRAGTVSATVPEPRLRVELGPTGPGQTWEFHVFALRNGRRIGRPWFLRQGNWNYSFRVGRESAP